MQYNNALKPIENPLPILADHPRYIEPLQCERRFLAPPVVNEKDVDLCVRAWRYWYNARGIIEMENRLEAKATAIIMVHPWGIDDNAGLKTPEPAGVAFFCARDKNNIAREHIREVVNPFLRRLRPDVALVGYSLPGKEDAIRGLMYASIVTPPEKLDEAKGRALLKERLRQHSFRGEPLVASLNLDTNGPVKSYFAQTSSTDAGARYSGAGFWDLPMPLCRDLERVPADLVFYDAEGYPKVRDFLKSRGIRHILLIGYCTDMCVMRTTCGYQNFSQDFNVFIVGDATLATFPGSVTPRFATQAALANAALTQLITQANWVRLEKAL
ncbi:MAG: cysteine hydrolase [Verrucomicrobia bacterium]|nr:cysteine hydrolase [Verrucomicrobiota bacterium]MBU1736338.1 cysteine hydrolase [Verrucomicrobiota bacterium]MBU1857359.1 cysteine hydrolase [Verrucomicrobiota bacterium]